MSEKFTPGPWAFQHNGAGDHETACICIDAVAPDRFIGQLAYLQSNAHVGGSTMEETEANAALMAASPDLYADLKTAAAQLRKYEELHRAKGTEDSMAKAEVNAKLASRFEATLAKARGEV